MEMLRPLTRLLQPVLTAILEYAGLVDKNRDAWCSTCMSLGYLYERGHNQPRRLSPTVLRDRSFDDFSKSADRGCPFCDVVLQSFMLLDFVTPEMRVKLLLYAESPAELHGPGWADFSEVIEIYPCPANTGHTYPIVGNDVPRVSSLRASVNFLKENFYTCLTEHAECVRANCLPKRVVDISAPRYRIVEPPVNTEGIYATLSYSWGSHGFAMTTSKNYEEMKLGFERDRLPIAFQDAAAIAKSLSISYLWIDTLCIVQDSVTDWEDEAAKMGGIFEGAAVTIAASLSDSPHHTLFGMRSPRYEEVELCSGMNGGPIDVVFKARRKIVQGIHAKTGRSRDIDPLDTRAWCFQETMLSSRVIAFTTAELQWTCQSVRVAECQSNPQLVQPLFPTSAETTNAKETLNNAKSWSQVIEEYTTRKLTFPEDRFPALSGLASKFGRATGYTYIAGGWKETLLYDLVWQRDLERAVFPSIWIAPSFSWACSTGAVNFRFARHSYPGSRIEHTQLVDFDYKTTAVDPYSRALEGSLTVKGHTLAAVLRRSPQYLEAYTIHMNDAVYSQNTDERAICEFSIDASVPTYDATTIARASEQSLPRTHDDAANQEKDELISLLSLYSIHHRNYLYHNFLILRKSQQDVDTYHRIGVGSGKMYRGSGCEVDFPSEVQHVRPFEWLLIDSEKSGRKFGEIVEQVLCIR